MMTMINETWHTIGSYVRGSFDLYDDESLCDQRTFVPTSSSSSSSFPPPPALSSPPVQSVSRITQLYNTFTNQIRSNVYKFVNRRDLPIDNNLSFKSKISIEDRTYVLLIRIKVFQGRRRAICLSN